jgi:hypothetical protein
MDIYGHEICSSVENNESESKCKTTCDNAPSERHDSYSRRGPNQSLSNAGWSID